MKIAITGGAGFIGSHLTKAYLDAGHDVLVIDSLVHGVRQEVDERARFYQMDIRDGKLRTLLQHERPDIVSHHAIQRNDTPIEQALADADVHVRGLLNVLDSSVNASVRKFIFASGGNSLYSRIDGQHPVNEDTPLYPRSAQDISKVAGEWYVRYYTQQHGLKHNILRYGDVYGQRIALPDQHPLNYFLSMLAERRRPIIRGTGNELRDHIFIDDVVRANLAVIRRGDNLTINIGSGHSYTLNQLYHLLTRAVGYKMDPMYLAGAPSEAASIMLDNTRARHILDWKAEISLTEGIQRVIEQSQERSVVASKSAIEEPIRTTYVNEARLSRV